MAVAAGISARAQAAASARGTRRIDTVSSTATARSSQLSLQFDAQCFERQLLGRVEDPVLARLVAQRNRRAQAVRGTAPGVLAQHVDAVDVVDELRRVLDHA